MALQQGPVVVLVLHDFVAGGEHELSAKKGDKVLLDPQCMATGPAAPPWVQNGWLRGLNLTKAMAGTCDSGFLPRTYVSDPMASAVDASLWAALGFGGGVPPFQELVESLQRTVSASMPPVPSSSSSSLSSSPSVVTVPPAGGPHGAGGPSPSSASANSSAGGIPSSSSSSLNEEILAEVMHDFSAEGANELSVMKGDVVRLMDAARPGQGQPWARVELVGSFEGGRSIAASQLGGCVPSSYLRLLPAGSIAGLSGAVATTSPSSLPPPPSSVSPSAPPSSESSSRLPPGSAARDAKNARDATDAEEEVAAYVEAMYDFEAAGPPEIALCAGDVLVVKAAEEDGWMRGKVIGNTKGERRVDAAQEEGFFPSSYVRAVGDVVRAEDGGPALWVDEWCGWRKAEEQLSSLDRRRVIAQHEEREGGRRLSHSRQDGPSPLAATSSHSSNSSHSISSNSSHSSSSEAPDLEQEVQRRIAEQQAEWERERARLERQIEQERTKAPLWLQQNPQWKEFFVTRLGASESELQDPHILSLLIEQTASFLVSSDAADNSSSSAAAASSPSSSASSVSAPSAPPAAASSSPKDAGIAPPVSSAVASTPSPAASSSVGSTPASSSHGAVGAAASSSLSSSMVARPPPPPPPPAAVALASSGKAPTFSSSAFANELQRFRFSNVPVRRPEPSDMPDTRRDDLTSVLKARLREFRDKMGVQSGDEEEPSADW